MFKGRIANKEQYNIIRGKAYVSEFLQEQIDIKENEYILICLKTDFTNLSNLTKFKAIVTAYGGILSHAAIYSREFNIPCIVGVENILTEIKNGDIIELNMNDGTIKKESLKLNWV